MTGHHVRVRRTRRSERSGARCSNSAKTATVNLDEWEPKLTTMSAYATTLDGVVLKRLGDELLALGRPKTSYELGVQQNLRVSLMCLHHGLEQAADSGYGYETLRLSIAMTEAGLTWRGSLEEAKSRVREAQHRVDDARKRLEYATLSDADRAQRESESAARRDAWNSLPPRVQKVCQNLAHGYHANGTFNPEGRRTGLDAMEYYARLTPEERAAL